VTQGGVAGDVPNFLGEQLRKIVLFWGDDRGRSGYSGHYQVGDCLSIIMTRGE